MSWLDEGVVELLKAVASVTASGEEGSRGGERKQRDSPRSDVIGVCIAIVERPRSSGASGESVSSCDGVYVEASSVIHT